MKVLDINPFHEGLRQNISMLSRLEKEMQAIKSSIEALVALEDTLKGEGGNAIRSFYAECHLPFLDFFSLFQRELTNTLEQMGEALNSLEPDPSGFIRESFLESEVETGLIEIAQLTETLTNEANDIMNTVNDIISLPHLNDTDVQEGVRNAKIKRDNTVTDLHEFDAVQLNQLSQSENDLSMMDSWLKDLEGLFNDNLTDVNFPSESWGQYAEQSDLRTELTKRTSDVSTVQEEQEKLPVKDPSKTTLDKINLANDIADKAGTIGIEGYSSFAVYRAFKKGGLRTEGGFRDVKTGVNSYRVYANEKGMKYLGAEVPNGNNKDVLLRAASDKPNPHNSKWFNENSQNVLKKHPHLEYWSQHASIKEKAQNFGKATLKGTKDSFTDIVDVKGIKNSGVLKGSVKALGPAGAGLSYYSNYAEAKEEGLTNKQAATRATVDTVVDTAIGGAVQAASVAAFTVAIPIPGLGTAVGIGVGMAINGFLNRKGTDKNGKPKKSAMEKIKGWFR